MKVILLLLCGLSLFSQGLFAQRLFDLKVIIDESIDINNLTFYCHNGDNEIYAIDSFYNNYALVKGEFYSKYVTVTMYYYVNDSVSFYRNYWIGTTPASIQLSYKHGCDIFDSAISKNMLEIDKENKEVLKQLKAYTSKELNAMNNLWRQKEEYDKSSFDSLHKIVFLNLRHKSEEYIKKHNDNYFYLWYYIDQFYGTGRRWFPDDISLFLDIRDSIKAIFSTALVNSYEAKKVFAAIDRSVSPQINIPAPIFNARSLNQKIIDLKNYRGKYVLIDFWATWCPPCMKDLNFIKALYEKYNKKGLEIIGVSLDYNLETLEKIISEKELDYPNIYDKDKKVRTLFTVDYIPVKILIDPQGNIIYNSMVREDRSTLMQLVETCVKELEKETNP